jgi:hypothetical protein
VYVHPRPDPNDRFRYRRLRARKRKRVRRALVGSALVAAAAAIALGATFFTRGGGREPEATPAVARGTGPAAAVTRRPDVPKEIRGVHVTMGLASIEGKLNQYLALRAYGLNTIELDVKDENGTVGFTSPAVPPLAKEVGAAMTHYDATSVARAAERAHIYLIGRVVTFADPTLAPARPDRALQWPDGTVWHDPAGLAWLNPHDRRNWEYAVDVAVAAAQAGFDEIQFDYVRFPSDGQIGSIVYPRMRKESKDVTIERFLRYASRRLHPLGVRVSADLFGLAATRDLGVGQSPRRAGKYLDAIYPMVYPSHFVPGEYHLVEPEAFPGRTVAEALKDYRHQTRGQGVDIVPWLQDFSLKRPYGLAEVEDQVTAARQMRSGGFLLWNPLGVYTQEALASR